MTRGNSCSQENKSEIKMCEMWLVFTIRQILQLDVFTANYAKMSLNDEENRFLVPVRLSLWSGDAGDACWMLVILWMHQHNDDAKTFTPCLPH